MGLVLPILAIWHWDNFSLLLARKMFPVFIFTGFGSFLHIKNIHLHIYEQLLQIFVDGLKYFYSNGEGKVDVTKLSIDDITKIQKYFESMNFLSKVDVFELMNYEFKF